MDSDPTERFVSRARERRGGRVVVVFALPLGRSTTERLESPPAQQPFEPSRFPSEHDYDYDYDYDHEHEHEHEHDHPGGRCSRNRQHFGCLPGRAGRTGGSPAAH